MTTYQGLEASAMLCLRMGGSSGLEVIARIKLFSAESDRVQAGGPTIALPKSERDFSFVTMRFEGDTLSIEFKREAFKCVNGYPSYITGAISACGREYHRYNPDEDRPTTRVAFSQKVATEELFAFLGRLELGLLAQPTT